MAHQHAFSSSSRGAPPLPAPSSTKDLENDLHGVPEPFVQDVLRQLGPRLVAGCRATTPLSSLSTVHNASQAPWVDATSLAASPLVVDCVFRPATAEALPPTHLLSFRSCPSASSSAHVYTGSTQLLPVHSLVFSLASPVLARLLTDQRRTTPLPSPPPSPPTVPCDSLSSPEVKPDRPSSPPQPTSSSFLLQLPVVSLPSAHLPFFHLLYDYLYTRCTSSLFRALVGLASPLPSDFSSLSPSSPPSTPAHTSAHTDTYLSLFLSHPIELLESSLARIQAFRHTVEALQVREEEVWETMQTAWEAVAKAIEELEGASDEEEDSGMSGDEEDEEEEVEEVR